MSTAAAIFAPSAPLPAAGASLPGAVPDTQGEGAFAGLLSAATTEMPVQGVTGFLKAAPQAQAATTGIEPVMASLVIDAPVAQVKGAVEAVIAAEGAVAESADDTVAATEAIPTEPDTDIATDVTPVVTQPLPAPTPVAIAPQPTGADEVAVAKPVSQAHTPAITPTAANDVMTAPAVEPLVAQPVVVDAAVDTAPVATPAATPAATMASDAVTASSKAAETVIQAQAKDAPKPEAEPTDAPVAPALKTEGREARVAAEASAPAGTTSSTTAEASAPTPSTAAAHPKVAAADTSSAKASGAEPADLTALEAPTDAAPSPDTDAQTAGAPAAAREAAQPQTTPAALASTLSRATVETTAQMSAQILRRLEGRSTHFDMVLTPEALGRVEVSVDIDADGQLAARLAFDNPAAALDLRGRADELRRQLEDAGFRLTDDSLSFTDRDSGRSGDQRQDGAARRFASAARVANEADQIVPAPRWMSMNLTPDRVDVRV